MKTTTSDFTITLTVDRKASEVFDAINNVRAWWTEDMEGKSQKLHDEFTVRFFDDIHVSTQKLEEVIADKKVVWLVTDSRLKFLENENEWTGTRISFEIAERNGQTHLDFTHFGLVPEVECYKDCTLGWRRYINGSLLYFLTDGIGKPEIKFQAARN